MSTENNDGSKSVNKKEGPKYVYLDKFNRYQIKVDKMLEDLERELDIVRQKYWKEITRTQMLLKATRITFYIIAVLTGVGVLWALSK